MQTSNFTCTITSIDPYNLEINGVPIFFISSKITSQFRFDFHTLAQVVNYADHSTLRKDTKDGWTRDFEITIPVHDQKKWGENKKKWEDLLTFLTGDRWKLHFTDINSNIQDTLIKSGKPCSISLLSGGLDSLIGAIDLIHTQKITFFSNTHDHKHCRNIQKEFEKTINPYIVGFEYHTVHSIKGENTQRSRSLLFLANALLDIDNSKLKNHIVQNIIIPENGFIAINIPLSYARLGSASTKTAHPYYLENLENLWHKHGLKIDLINPYQDKTKGEMLEECKDQNLLQNLIEVSMSCAHPKKLVKNNTYYHSGKDLHCGYCWPCLIRKASLEYYRLKTKFSDPTKYSNLTITPKGISTTDYAMLKRFIQCYKDNAIQDDGEFFIRVPKTSRINIASIQSLMIRGISELQRII